MYQMTPTEVGIHAIGMGRGWAVVAQSIELESEKRKGNHAEEWPYLAEWAKEVEVSSIPMDQDVRAWVRWVGLYKPNSKHWGSWEAKERGWQIQFLRKKKKKKV